MSVDTQDLMNELVEAHAKIEQLERSLAEAATAWIPVTERMPDADGTVLGALKDDNEPVWLVYYDGADWVTAEGQVCKVTHWMPLPEAPK